VSAKLFEIVDEAGTVRVIICFKFLIPPPDAPKL